MAYYGGTDGDNTLVGGQLGASTANDTLQGFLGNDTYAFTEFSGHVIRDSGGEADRILFDSTVSRGNVRLTRDSYPYTDLLVTVVDEFDQVVSSIRIDDHFSGPRSRRCASPTAPASPCGPG